MSYIHIFRIIYVPIYNYKVYMVLLALVTHPTGCPGAPGALGGSERRQADFTVIQR